MKYSEFSKKIRSPLFTSQDVRLAGGRVFAYQLSLWQKQGYIIKLRNGIYLFSDKVNDLAPEEVGGALYGPSYVSLEKALSIYGLIPEMVYAITLVTPKTTRAYKTKAGNYIFRHVKPALFFGYRQQQGRSRAYLLAEPEKALLDLLYLNRIKDASGLGSLRINWRTAGELINKDKFRKYLAKYSSKAMALIGALILEKI
jgi:predicted transcriptional regulator of viral defense system